VCYRCGGANHFARDCPEETPKCYSCGERCKNYKAAVEKMRRQDRGKQAKERASSPVQPHLQSPGKHD
jgi:hypothetical protein